MSFPLKHLGDHKEIVLIEDSEDLCKGWSELLSFSGYRTNCFFTGFSALEHMACIKESSLLITDYYLPDMNGIDLITRVRQECSDLPIILLTGAKERDLKERLSLFANTKLLNKPIGIDDLEAAIESLIKEPAGEAESTNGK